MTITLGAGGETSMSLKWARCARDEEFKSNGVSLRFGEKALCRDVELANYDAPVRGAMFLLAEGDVMPNAVKKRIPPQGKPSIEISGDLAASRQGGKLEARPNYRSIIGTIAGEPVDAVLERKSDVYYAVLDKTGTPLSTVFIIRQGEQTVRYHLRGLSVKPDGKLDVDAEVLLAPGESITVNTEKQKD